MAGFSTALAKARAAADRLTTGVAGSMMGMGAVAVASQLAVLAASPILTRLYTVSDFGLFGLFVSFVTILAAVPSLGLHEAIIAPRSDREAFALLTAAWAGSLGVGALVALAGAGLVATDLFGSGVLPWWANALVYPSIAAIAATMALQYWLIRRHDWPTIRRMTIAQGLLRVVLQVGLGLAQLGFIGLALGETLMRLLVLGYGIQRVWTDIAGRARGIGRSAPLSAVRAYRHFPLTRTPSALLNNIGAMITVPLVAMQFGVAAAGHYTLMETVINAPLGLANKAVGEVFLGHIARRLDDRAAARRFLFATALGLAALALVPCAALAVFGPALFASVFGEAWRQSGVLAALMTPVLFIRFIVGPLSGTLNAVNRPELKLVFDFGAIAAIGCCFLYADRSGADLQTTVMLLAGSLSLAYIVQGGLILWGLAHPRAAPEPDAADSRPAK